MITFLYVSSFILHKTVTAGLVGEDTHSRVTVSPDNNIKRSDVLLVSVGCAASTEIRNADIISSIAAERFYVINIVIIRISTFEIIGHNNLSKKRIEERYAIGKP